MTAVLLGIAMLVSVLPPLFGGFFPPIVVSLVAMARLTIGLIRNRGNSPLRMLESAALPLSVSAALASTLFGMSPKLISTTMSLLLAVESLGRLFELIGRHRSGVLSAVDDNQQVALPSSWRDNSAFAAKIKQLAMLVEWARYPAAVAMGVLTFFITSGHPADALLSFAIVLVGMNPRILRMATGDAHLSAALIASKQGVMVRDAHAVDALANSRIALFIGKSSIYKGPPRIVDWRSDEAINEQSLLDALLSIESGAEGEIADAIADFASSRKARAAAAAEVTYTQGQGAIGTTPWGKLVCGTRQLLLDNDILTGVMEPHAQTIESSGRRAVFVALDGKTAAVFGLEEPLVPDAEETVQTLRHLGLETALITSAESLAAESLGNRLGIETIYPNSEEERIGELLQGINARGDHAVLVGHGAHFEEHLRSATAAIAIGNTDKTQAGFDTKESGVSIVPLLVRVAKRANLSVVINLVAGISATLLSLGIAASWFAPSMMLFVGIFGTAAAAGATFNAPYPMWDKLYARGSSLWTVVRKTGKQLFFRRH